VDARELDLSSGFEHRIGRSVSLDDAAELLGVSRRTIYNRIRRGDLKTVRTIGGSQRVLLDSIDGIEAVRQRIGTRSLSGSDAVETGIVRADASSPGDRLEVWGEKRRPE